LLFLQENDETDSGYRSGTIPEEKLPRKPSQATLNREELKLKIEEYNLLVPGAEFSLVRYKLKPTFTRFWKQKVEKYHLPLPG